MWGTLPLSDPTGATARVDVISGACLMIRRHIYEALGGLSRDYFMYAEDVDLCYRARQMGWNAYYTGQAEVIHHGGRSSDSATQNNFAAIVMRESLVKFMQNTRGRFYALGYQATTGAVALCRWLMLSGAWLLTVGRGDNKSLSMSRAKWGKIFRWAIGLEGWAKKLA
jgi:GT2 family glycosyltransferase